jgi:tetratricopeptide (TPR) repeat protein
LGIVFAKQGRYDEAIRAFQQALMHEPESAEAHKNIGIAYSYQGRLEAAMQEFQTALRIDPGHTGARSQLEIVSRKLRGRKNVK